MSTVSETVFVPRRARHAAPRTPLREAVRDWFAARRQRAAQVTDVPAEPIAAAEPPSVSAHLVQLATQTRLFCWADERIAPELTRLVPHLHPTEARDRFRGLQDACEGVRNVEARLGDRNPDVREAAESGLPYFKGLVDDRLRHLFAPTIAFNEDGSQWSAVTAEAVAA